MFWNEFIFVIKFTPYVPYSVCFPYFGIKAMSVNCCMNFIYLFIF